MVMADACLLLEPLSVTFYIARIVRLPAHRGLLGAWPLKAKSEKKIVDVYAASPSS
jgi:hypothetical protein